MIEALTNLARLAALAALIAVSLRAYGRTRNPGFLVLLFTLFVWPLVFRTAAEVIAPLDRTSRDWMDTFAVVQLVSLFSIMGLLTLSVLLLASSRLTFPRLRR